MEAVILICDRGDGLPATESLRFKIGQRNMQLDLCSQHLQELGERRPPGATRSSSQDRLEGRGHREADNDQEDGGGQATRASSRFEEQAEELALKRPTD